MKILERLFLPLLVLTFTGGAAHAQLTAIATPPSFNTTLTTPVPTADMAPVDHTALLMEDAAEYEAMRQTGEDPGFRSAVPLDVALDFSDGIWDQLPNGDRIWRLRISSPGATDLCLRYDRWRLMKPCELWLYNDDHSSLLGPHTYIDNWDGTKATNFTKGDNVTLEYHVPAGVEDIGELSISHVAHGYKHVLNRHADDALDAFGDALPCHINVRCWPDFVQEAACVALVFAPTFGRWCSGAMLNNTLQDGTPYFLTADHCWRTDVTNWVFKFNYESPTCTPSADGDSTFTVTDAAVVSRWADSDFLLLRLSRPRPDAPFIPRFMGWDRNNVAPSQSWGIHHPAGDVKKISYDAHPAVSDNWNGGPANTHWRVTLDQGMTQGGSSGSPLFNPGSYVVGQLHGGVSVDCMPDTAIEKYYGKLSASWQGGGTAASRLRDWLDPNNSGATFVNSMQPLPPDNDSCGAGQNVPLISYVPYSASGSTIWAANNHSGGIGSCTPTNTAPDVVYLLYMNCQYEITVSLCGSDYDTRLYVESASDCGDTTPFDNFCNDDFCGFQSQLSFTAQSGVFYKIWVDGYGSASGNYVLNVTGTASGSQGNAACPGYQITTVPYFTWGANWCGGDQVNPTCRPTSDGDDVHWYWVSPYNQAMRAKTCFNNYDTILEVKHGGACPGNFSAGCNDDFFCGDDPLASTVVWNAVSGLTYYVHLDGYGGATGMASLELEVYNDDCSSPIVITGLPSNHQGDTRPARDDFATFIGPNSREVFFQYTSPICQTVQVHTCDANNTLFDTAIEIRTGGSCPGSTLVAYNDDGGGNCGLASNVLFQAEANRTYYIVVGGYNVAAGPFMVYFSGGNPAGAPLADVCPGIVVPSLPFTDQGNTGCMVNNYTNCVGTTSREMVYRIVRPTCEMVTVSLCGSDYDTGLGVYGGNCPNIAPLIACNDDSYCGNEYTLQSTLTFRAEANTNYNILVHGYAANFGRYVINVTGTPCLPDPPEDVVSQVDIASGNVVLNWSAVPGVNAYHIYRSSDYATLFNPENVIFITDGTSWTCSNCINDPAVRSFFGVRAAGQGLLAAEPVEPRNTEGLTKNDAVQGPVTVSLTRFDPPVPTEQAVGKGL